MTNITGDDTAKKCGRRFAFDGNLENSGGATRQKIVLNSTRTVLLSGGQQLNEKTCKQGRATDRYVGGQVGSDHFPLWYDRALRFPT